VLNHTHQSDFLSHHDNDTKSTYDISDKSGRFESTYTSDNYVLLWELSLGKLNISIVKPLFDINDGIKVNSNHNLK